MGDTKTVKTTEAIDGIKATDRIFGSDDGRGFADLMIASGQSYGNKYFLRPHNAAKNIIMRRINCSTMVIVS